MKSFKYALEKKEPRIGPGVSHVGLQSMISLYQKE